MTGASSSARARRRAPRLQGIREKIGSVEAEIAVVEESYRLEPSLFPQEHPGLRSLRQRLAQLGEVAAGIETELRRRWERLS